MSFIYPLWCIVCKEEGFVGTRFEKPGTAAPYVNYCPSCGTQNVIHKQVGSQIEHKEIKENSTYEDLV